MFATIEGLVREPHQIGCISFDELDVRHTVGPLSAARRWLLTVT